MRFITLQTCAAWLACCAGCNPPTSVYELAVRNDDAIDAKAFIESLVNKNPPPELIRKSYYEVPLFDVSYDWDEYKRVHRQLRQIAEHAEVLWPELVKHLEDDRYCITVESSTSSSAYTFTVGDVCQAVIRDALSAAYFQSLKPRRKSTYSKLRLPQFTVDNKKLKEWCEARSGKRLYRLQMEACGWTLELLKKDGNLDEVSEEGRRAWIATLEADIVKMKQTKKPANCRWFQGESYGTYSASEAEAIHKELLENE